VRLPGIFRTCYADNRLSVTMYTNYNELDRELKRDKDRTQTIYRLRKKTLEVSYTDQFIIYKNTREMHKSKMSLILFSLVRHTTKLNFRIIVKTVQCDSICWYLLPLHVSVSWPSSEGMRSTCSETTITWFVMHT
jgi:hypothetical protein